ncbi:bleomycin resistance protein [Micromonospora craterilacus]|uniref:Bleomycin resistance protein n=1 Tax=Micromonospora craterilacus TaxID=1655439 RepID=A0A2W2F7J2_9ACTN|nr:VOC family protein [Micromonospora craterilacus]PZG17547.1 bleomycin resistance protein [Micromonospora craterilacus]
MTLSLDIITIGVPQVEAARDFYTSAFSSTANDDDHTASLDLHGTGQLALHQIDVLATNSDTNPATSGFRGYVLSSIVNQPAEVKALLDAAIANGATVIKPAKKQLFGEFNAVYRAPDGAVWKVAAASKKDMDLVPDPPKPTETAVFLGVAKPTASKAFYETLGMSVDRDYGDKFIDFTITGGVCRLGLLLRKALAKDAGVDEHGDGFSALVLTHTAASRDGVDTLLAAAAAAGGRVTAAATQTDQGHYAGHFTDLDGYHWRITTNA